MTRRRVIPRPALSARQVDRVEKEVRRLRAIAERISADHRPGGQCHVCNLIAGLTRLLASVRSSERR